MWCDSKHAVDSAAVAKTPQLKIYEIVERVGALQGYRAIDHVNWITLSGGNPCLFDLNYLITALKRAGFYIAVETQGSIFREWLYDVDQIVVSPKPPSSEWETSLDTLEKFIYQLKEGEQDCALKVVVFNKSDLEYAVAVHKKFPKYDFYVSTGAELGVQRRYYLNDYRKVVEAVLQEPDLYDARVCCQQHVLLWGHEKGR